MDLDALLIEIQRKEKDMESFEVVYIEKKLKVPIIICPKCTKPFIPTKKSPDICLFCKRLFS